MGVAGSGKSTIGAALAAAMGGVFIDADDLHSAANRAKMTSGHPLTDEDRWPWLDACAQALAESSKTRFTVLGCSALKRAYRDRLRAGVPNLTLVYPQAPRELVEKRMAARQGHYMPTALLDSQYAALEPPAADENPLVVSVQPPVAEIVQDVVSRLGKG